MAISVARDNAGAAASLGRLRRELHLTSPPQTGGDVLAVQQYLRTAGFAPGRLDGVYGPTTAATVRAYQRHNALAVDGVVGPATIAAMTGARPVGTPIALRRPGSRTGVKALAEARKWLGYRESPAGSNRTRFGHWFGVDGVPWCNIFVSYCFAVGADYTLCAGFRGAGVYRRGCTYVPTTEAWLRATGMWEGRTTALPGDIAIFNWDRAGVPEHIGLVERNLGGGRVQTIEGNTSLGNNSNGGAVMRRLRYLTQVDGFGRIHSNHH
jgi:hypothetical protein